MTDDCAGWPRVRECCAPWVPANRHSVGWPTPAAVGVARGHTDLDSGMLTEARVQRLAVLHEVYGPPSWTTCDHVPVDRCDDGLFIILDTIWGGTHAGTVTAAEDQGGLARVRLAGTTFTEGQERAIDLVRISRSGDPSVPYTVVGIPA